MACWIIVVDDDVTNLKMAGQILSKHNMRVTAVKSGKALLEYVEEHGFPELILLDINMPEMDGFETYGNLRALEADKGVPQTPVVMLTADEDKTNESRGFEMGVSDYIRKPFDPDVLVRRVENIISTRGRMLKFEEEATIDKLTGFLNKYNANEQVSALCGNKNGTLMIVDLDSFKLVNDIYGHEMGDRVLAKFSQILRNNMNFPTVFGRIGGDEFMLFAELMHSEKDIAKFSEAINQNLTAEARLMMGEDMSIPLGASIGAVLIPEQGTEFNELFRLADRALYTIKNNGKHGYALYRDEDAESAIPSDINLAMLTTILEERNIPQNAMWMGKEAFGNVYRYMIRYMDRYRGTAYKMLFTARFLPKDLSQSEKEKIMVSLRELLQESLRNSDIMMQIGDNHFFLMLPEISDYNVGRVTERVMHAWKNNEYSGLVELSVETESTDSEMHESVVDRPDGDSHIVGQFAVHGLIDAPLATEQLQVVLLGSLDGILEVGTDVVDVPYLGGEMVLVDDCLDGVAGSLVVFLRYEHTGVVHLTLVLADGCPPCAVMRQNHRVIIVERQHDVLVALGNLQILDGSVALPQVRTDDQCALRLTFAQGLVHLGHQLIPLLVVFSHRLVHEFVSYRVVAIALQCVRQLIPQIDQVLLGLLRCEQRVGSLVFLVHGIEIVRTDDVQVDDGTQMVLITLVKCEGQQVPCLGQFVALFIPELHLVNGNAHKVETQRIQTGKVVLLDVQPAGLTAVFVVLRQPVAQVRAALNTEVVHFVRGLTLGAARC